MASSNTTDLEGWAVRGIQGVISREIPELQGRWAGAKFNLLSQSYFRLFRIIECTAGPDHRILHAAYRQDNSNVFLLSGKQHSIRLIAAIDPVAFRSADDVLSFAAFADKVTSEDSTPAKTVSSVDEIGPAAGMSKGDKAVLADIQEKFRGRIQPVERQVLPFGLQERFHVISTKRLIERTRMIASGGIFFRQDEVLADNLPVGR
jgi:hypothetical protein